MYSVIGDRCIRAHQAGIRTGDSIREHKRTIRGSLITGCGRNPQPEQPRPLCPEERERKVDAFRAALQWAYHGTARQDRRPYHYYGGSIEVQIESYAASLEVR